MKISYFDLLIIIQSMAEDVEIYDLDGLCNYLEENADVKIELVNCED